MIFLSIEQENEAANHAFDVLKPLPGWAAVQERLSQGNLQHSRTSKRLTTPALRRREALRHFTFQAITYLDLVSSSETADAVCNLLPLMVREAYTYFCGVPPQVAAPVSDGALEFERRIEFRFRRWMLRAYQRAQSANRVQPSNHKRGSTGSDMSSTNQAATANQEGQEFRRVGDDEPDESDMYAAYRDDKPAIKFFKTNDDVKSFLRADDGYGQRNDQWWRGGIPIHAPDYPPGPKCDWERIKELLKEEETLKYRQRERDSTSGGSTEKTKERLRLKIHVTSAGLDPLPTCFIRDFATIETNAMHRRGHQYEQLQIEAKDVPRRLWLFFEDLVSAYRYQFPEASCAAVADFMTSLNVHHRLEQDANGITRFFGISHLDYALKFMLRRVAGLADEIRTEVFTPPVGERQSKSGEVELTSQQPARLRTRGNLPQDKGNLQLLGSTDGALKKAVTLEIARRFGGVTRRAIDHAAQKGFLKSVGKRQQRRILVDSLLEYFPPEK